MHRTLLASLTCQTGHGSNYSQRCAQTHCGSLRCWRSDKLVILQYVQMWLYEPRGFVSEATATSLWCSAEHVPTSCLGVAGR